MIKINLNPKKKGAITKAEKKKFGLAVPKFKAPVFLAKLKGLVYILIPTVLVVLEVLYYLNLNLRISGVKSDIKILKQDIDKYKLLAQKIKRLEAELENQEILQDNIRTRIMVYQKFALEKGDILNMFRAIAIAMPDGVWITNLRLARNSSRLTGYSLQPEKISQFYENLSYYYQTVNFSSTQRRKGKVIDFYRFNFSMNNWKSPTKNDKDIAMKKRSKNKRKRIGR